MDTKSRNILLTTPYFFPHGFGGGQTYVYNLAKELKRRGHNVTIVSSGSWQGGTSEYNISSYEYDTLPVTTVSLNPEAVSEEDTYSELSSALLNALKGLVKRHKPDLLHINGLKPAAIRVCNELEIPHVVTAHHPGIACPNAMLLRPDETVCNKPASIEICLPCCSMWRVSRNKPTGWLLGNIPKWLYDWAGEIALKQRGASYIIRGLRYPRLIEKSMEGGSVILHEAHYIISPSEAMRELLVRNGVPLEKIFFSTHGIKPLPKLPIEIFEGRAVRFGYIGSVSFAKGFHVLTDALKMLSGRYELHIYGGSATPSSSNFLTTSLKHANSRGTIINHGYVPHHKIIDAFEHIDVLVAPSISLEVFGLVVAEALSAGRPVIVSDSGGPAEQVEDGLNGFIIRRNDSRSLAEAMQTFLDNPALIMKMSKYTSNVRTMEEHGDEIERVYSYIIEHNDPIHMPVH